MNKPQHNQIRCNNCMTIYQDDIEQCNKCKTDKYLMDNFKPQHTPTPWRASSSSLIINESGDLIANCLGIGQEDNIDRNQANAEFIVTSCNNHYSMVSLLKQCLKEGVSNDTKTKIEEMLRACEKN